MNSKQRQRRSSLVLVFVIGAAFILLVLALAFGGGGGRQSQNNDRSAPAPVHNRVTTALGSNNKQALYDELSPSMKQLIPSDGFLSGQSSASGSVIVEMLDEPQFKTGVPWNGEWADAKVRVTHDGLVEEYVVRYHLENGEWWLYATLKVK